LPKVAFMAMDARHCAGAVMAHAAAVGSAVAQRRKDVTGAGRPAGTSPDTRGDRVATLDAGLIASN
jgi:hypothetical protein